MVMPEPQQRVRRLPPVPPPPVVPAPTSTTEFRRRNNGWRTLLRPGCYWRRNRLNAA